MKKIKNKYILYIIVPIILLISSITLGVDKAMSQSSSCSYSFISFYPDTNTATIGNAPPEVIVTVGFNGCAGKTIELLIRNAQQNSQIRADQYLIKSGDIEAKFAYTPSSGCISYVNTWPPYCIFYGVVNEVGGPPNVYNTANSNVGTPGKLVYESITNPTNFTWNLKSVQGVGAQSPQGPLNPGGATPATTLPKLDNPLCAQGSSNCIDSIPELIQQLLEVIILVAIPLVALAIMYSGFLLVWGAATGNSSKIEQGKKALLYSIIGGAILLGAWVIAEVIGQTVNDLAGYN